MPTYLLLKYSIHSQKASLFFVPFVFTCLTLCLYTNISYLKLLYSDAETFHLHLLLHLIDLHRYKYICKQASNSYARIIKREGKTDKKKGSENN